MKIALIGTYTPRQCGIGSFSKNLFDSLSSDTGNTAQNFVVAINDPGGEYNYPAEVKHIIRQDDHDTYLKAADVINQSGADLCLIQHEYGIFGGQNGVYILALLHSLEIPVVATFHTVLKKPSYNELYILKEITKIAQRVVVMADKAVELLQTIYEIPASKIVVIPHGVPDIQYDRRAVRQELKLTDRKVLLTFGFIGRNKGIETAITALPAVVHQHPDVRYIVLGKTHPNVIKHAGEEYRLFLHRLVKKLQLEEHVVFLNQYASQHELFKYLTASDIYITPYLNEAQITSGTLSYALGVGSAVVSTPYWHAAELLADGRGALFDFNDSQQLAAVLIDLFSHPEKLAAMRSRALEFGELITWPKIGELYSDLFRQVIQHALIHPIRKDPAFDRSILPPLRLDHVVRLTDSTGIFQHATYGIPNYHEGYCLDDNARALLMALMAYRRAKDETALRYIPTYLAYIHYAQNDDGTFRNFMGFNRNFLDKVGSEDAFGRAIWAIGYAMAHAPKDAYFQVARKVFFKAVPQFERLQSIRSIANTILGLYHYLKSHPTDDGMMELTHRLALRLHREYTIHRRDNWHWYESLLAYDNALLPLSMMRAGELLNDDTFRQVGFESMAFLETHTMHKGYLSLVGNEAWFKQDGTCSRFDQQPVDAMATVLLFLQAYNNTGDPHYLRSVYTAFMWFLGENDLRISLYDFETGGCCDGLEKDGVNRNQGAESTLAYLISYLAVQQTFEKPTNRILSQETNEDSHISSHSLADAAS
ncbi:glycosyltransferase family 4 protein [Parapedobacter sp. ISTM3]|uniref:Glycosyltransferase involved in cell wall bisynthesis n=1 Tax=Parapedobacter luteus TaxID=623280 RepID=A0A1T5E297_9SPHI|nr:MULTISPECIES: glycosyltransferase family 4 protein [Parapedobacter]MBK1441022.1 glycosyltransferase family 4 protein [Parapedobacter sp. ISTM3]SKB77910.1 Glycosyltransferase involved in cell wall bisynthesis [Parapedobacter luteus]